MDDEWTARANALVPKAEALGARHLRDAIAAALRAAYEKGRADAIDWIANDRPAASSAAAIASAPVTESVPVAALLSDESVNAACESFYGSRDWRHSDEFMAAHRRAIGAAIACAQKEKP